MDNPIIYKHSEIRCRIQSVIIIKGDWLSSDYDIMLRDLYYIPIHIAIKKTYHPLTDETYVTVEYNRTDLIP